MLLIVVQKGEDVSSLELVASMQEVEFHDKPQTSNIGTQRLSECYRGGRSSTGGEKIVDNDHALAFLNRVFMDLKSVAAVFQIVFDPGGGRGQLAGFANRDEPGVQTIG